MKWHEYEILGHVMQILIVNLFIKMGLAEALRSGMNMIKHTVEKRHEYDNAILSGAGAAKSMPVSKNTSFQVNP